MMAQPGAARGRPFGEGRAGERGRARPGRNRRSRTGVAGTEERLQTERISGAPALHLEIDGPAPASPAAAAPSVPTLCLLHGFGGSARNWRPQMRALRTRARVAAFDVRGHARSEAPGEESAYAPACFVDDVGRVLDTLGVPRQPRVRRDAAVVGGLSMGAGIAARFAIAHPERVRGLVLAAPAPGARGAGDADAGAARQRDWALAFADAIERDGLEAAGTRYAWGPESGLDPAAAQMVRLGFLEHAPHAIASTLRRLLAQQPGWREFADALRPHRLPLLVVVGARDRVSREASEQLAAALPDTMLVVVPDAGHVVNLEARAPVSEALAHFLDALPDGATPESEP